MSLDVCACFCEWLKNRNTVGNMDLFEENIGLLYEELIMVNV
jgi:hypothetical protein